MPRKKKKPLLKNQHLIETITGSVFILLAVIVFFGREGVVQGLVHAPFASVFGPDYRWIFSPIIGIYGIGVLFGGWGVNIRRMCGILLFWVTMLSLLGLLEKSGGAFLDFHTEIIGYIDTIPFVFLAILGFLFSLWAVFGVNYLRVVQRIQDTSSNVYQAQKELASRMSSEVKQFRGNLEDRKEVVRKKKEALKKRTRVQDDAPVSTKKIRNTPARNKKEESAAPKKIGRTIPVGGNKKTNTPKEPTQMPDFGGWKYPSLELLEKHVGGEPMDRERIELQAVIIEETLLQFNIPVTMKGYEAGPTVIQHRLQPDTGIKLNKIENLKKNLALALKAKSIRIQAPIPGVGLVGIEVPNESREIVSLKDIASTSSFLRNKSKLAMCAGSSIDGKPVICDLAKMPHLLIAGQTGAGKSVGMNGFLISLLLRNSPSELRMILVDPKRVELGIYNGIPHLLTPVINHPDKALNALKWCVVEMMRRYDLLTEARVRNLGEFNAKVDKKERLPFIAIVIDELADLMMSGNKKEVEHTVARIAQMARAVGMHLIVATQRPSVDVITGLIKANIPSRIAFTVASGVDSKTVVDRIGAEDLLGRGDMLYLPSGAMNPDRVQGVLVETREVERIVNEIKRTIDPNMLDNIYDDSIINPPADETGGFGGADGGDDEVLNQALEIVRSSGKASTSYLQRRMKIGYNKAARIMDQLEDMGVVGPENGSKPREVIG